MTSAKDGLERISLILVGVAAMTAVFSRPASAQLYDEKWTLNFGGELSTFSSKAQLDSEETGNGTEIDLERNLGLDERKTNFRFEGAYRFSRKNQLEMGFSQRVRSNTHILDRDIEWGGVTYPVEGQIKTRFSTNLFQAAWKHSLLAADAVEAGFSLGLSSFWLSASIAGEGEVTGGEIRYETKRSDFVAPVPVVGLFLNWAMSRNVVLRVSGDYFDATYQGRNATLTEATGAIDVTPWENVGLGLAYNWSNLEYNRGERASLRVDLTTEALFGYVRVVF